MTQISPSSETLAAPERVRRFFPLHQLGIAPENLRASEPADEAVPELAETIAAAGVLQLLTVRPGRGKREKPAMALDGRRRLLALWSLRDAGRIGDDYPVEAFVETDPARQAATAVLTNTAVPVHVADVIVAVGQMLKARLAPTAIAAALGYGEVEVRRLAALAGLPPRALEALRLGRVNLRQARLLARLPDRRQQAEIAAAAIAGHGFQEWRITDQLDAGRLTDRDPRFALVGAARYAQAGGRTDTDLFNERPATLLDPAALQTAWRQRAAEITARLGLDEAEVRVAAGDEEVASGLETFGHSYGMALDGAARDAWRAAEVEVREAAERLAEADLEASAADDQILDYLRARLAACRAEEPARAISLVRVTPSRRTGLDLDAYGPAPTLRDDAADDRADDSCNLPGAEHRSLAPAESRPRTPLAQAPAPEVAGVGHSLHAVRTDVATRALVRAVADDPPTAFIALVARLFGLLVLREGVGRGGGALSVQAEPFGPSRTTPMVSLDGDVRRRLTDRRAAWEASAKTPIAWVADLSEADRMTLMAELVGLSVDLREERTTGLRHRARAEAVEIAALCGADVTRHWTPDAPFLAAHPKGLLMAMLQSAGGGDAGASSLRKAELVEHVAKALAQTRWAPGFLSWAPEPPTAPDAEHSDPDAEG